MPTPRSPADQPARRWALVSTLLTLLCLGACTKSGATPEAKVVDVAELPPYSAEAAELFDDSLAIEIFGLKVDHTSVENNDTFTKRVNQANRIQAVRLRTIQQDRVGENVRYRLIVSPLAPPLAGPAFESEGELQVGRASPSLNLIRAMDVELVGRTFIVMVQSFRLGDERVEHFRAEADTPEMRASIAKLRGEPPAENQ